MTNEYERLIKEFKEKNKDNKVYKAMGEKLKKSEHAISILEISAVDLDTGRYDGLYSDMIACIDIIEMQKNRKLYMDGRGRVTTFDKIREIPQIKILLEKIIKLTRTQEEVDVLFD